MNTGRQSLPAKRVLAAALVSFCTLIGFAMPLAAHARTTSGNGVTGGAPGVVAADGAVGQVSLLVGQARALSAGGAWRNLQRGAPIRVGDRIETQAGGHVHVQFVDGGRMSVRPSSRLVIEDYTAPDPARPGTGAIRFQLEEGVVRSITGRWGESARDRFRLNTPLAAIGVKGTDFAVRSQSDRTEASVYTGAIVVANRVAGCAAAVGPCGNGTEQLLTATMRGQMVELSKNQPAPQLVPAVDLLAQSARSALPLMARSGGEPASIGSTTTTAGASTPSASTNTPPANAGGDAAARPALTESIAANVVRQAVAPPVIEDMVWLRPRPQAAAGDTLSRVYSAAEAAGRRPTVGSLDYTLFSAGTPFSANTVIAGGETVANFRLGGASASLVSSEGKTLEGVQVGAGSLRLDFTRQLFSTSLVLSSALLGQTDLTASGQITSAGYFFSLSDLLFLAGAVNGNAKEAGYFFEKRVDPGVVRGITLWGR
jgi:hypothetical protein